MTQESLSLESSKIAKAATAPSQTGGLKWTITSAFSGVIIVLGLCVIGIVYYLTGNALQHQVELRATAIATNLSDASAAYVSKKSVLELDALIAKYGRLEGVAYAFVQDAKGEVLASSLQPFPAELKGTSPAQNQRSSSSKTTTLRGRSVYDT